MKQIKLRTALIIVLLAALFTYGWELSRRRKEYAQRVRINDRRLQFYDDASDPMADPETNRHLQYQAKMRKYHDMLIQKYEYARDHPWIPVEPDPAPPERPGVDSVGGTK